ncbi:hypothetical protein [Halomicrococcus gelatinilyticus]|uniref:hypothetical protein n=1 Tax=Halomicrococcus gelatinilyticus TaxID=1702103 RepID=UPI002E0F8D0C
MTDRDPTRLAADGDEPSADDIYDAMEPFVPYTTDEIADRFQASTGLTWTLLRDLAAADRIRKKEPEPNLRLWIREPPANQCPICDSVFQVRFLRPGPGAVHVCPRCSARVDR